MNKRHARDLAEFGSLAHGQILELAEAECRAYLFPPRQPPHKIDDTIHNLEHRRLRSELVFLDNVQGQANTGLRTHIVLNQSIVGQHIRVLLDQHALAFYRYVDDGTQFQTPAYCYRR